MRSGTHTRSEDGTVIHLAQHWPAKIADDVPIVELVKALNYHGFTVSSMKDGALLIHKVPK